MSDEGEATVARRPHAVHVRVRAGLRKPNNWLQLAKFCAVGGSGYVVNLAVFALCVEGFGAHHLVAATVAFVVAVVNNFWWNRHWTFDARGGPRRLPGAALLRGEHRRLPGRGDHPRGARERRRHARAARAGNLHRGVHPRSTSSGTRFGASPSRCRGTEGRVGSGALRRARRGCRPAAAADLRQPASQTEPPRFFERSAERGHRLAERGERSRPRSAAAAASTRPPTSRARVAGR